ncbi:MAG: FAD binding domain-containing protein, partial [Rhizobiales bacterium]|nr:FAD binding domain-containing protein [Hyphomicrobiales bacterium]
MYEFKYQRPISVRQASNMLAKDPEAKILAGGYSLLPVMKLRLARPSQLLDIGRIEGLSGIELKGRSLVIGATTRHVDVANSEVAQQALPVIAKLAAGIGDPHIRHRGTIGGSLANNDPN